MATLSEVAAEAGVSPTAVSRYLNKRIALPLSTRKRIDAAIAKLDYRPNVLARRLSTGKTEALSLVAADIANPFFAELAAAVEREAHERGYAVYISSTASGAGSEADAIRRLTDGHVDGLIMMTNQVDDGTLARLLDGLGNVVLLDEAIAGPAVPKILVENAEGTAMATRHLLAAGHRDIALISGPPRLLTVTERLAGFMGAMAEAGLEVPPGRVLLGSYTSRFGDAAATVLLEEPNPPTAILACSDFIAMGVVRAARRRGLVIPDDLSLVGFDDMAIAELIDPPLTTVRQPIEEMGRLAVRHLLCLLDGEQAPPAETRLPVRLILRHSVAAPPIEAKK